MSKMRAGVSNGNLVVEADALSDRKSCRSCAMVKLDSEKVFKGFRAISSVEAARTRSVAKRSLKERGVVTRHMTTKESV